ncbi:hypothetical protein WDW89_23690 [Deltaproteobacteria bacterium TL4]
MKNTSFKKMVKWQTALCGMLLLLLSGCAETGTDEAAEFQIVDANTPVSFDIMYDSFLELRCVRCHSWSNEADIQRYIVPGNPDYSDFYSEVSSEKMPPGGPKLTEYQQGLLRRYIEGLAQKPQ